MDEPDAGALILSDGLGCPAIGDRRPDNSSPLSIAHRTGGVGQAGARCAHRGTPRGGIETHPRGSWTGMVLSIDHWLVWRSGMLLAETMLDALNG